MARARKRTPWYRKDRDMWFVTIDGVQISLDVKGAENQDSANLALVKLLAQLGTTSPDQNPPTPPAPPAPKSTTPPATTLRQAINHFLERARERVAAVTYVSYNWHLTQLAAALGEATPVASITAEQIESSARRGKWSSSTRHDYIGAAGVLMKDAGFPMRLRRPPKESRGADAVWTDEEWLMMLGAARGDFKPLLIVLKETGCRPAEAAALTVENVDWELKLCRLKRHKTAAKGKHRILHFSALVMESLLEQKRQYASGHLFLNEESRPFTGLSISRRLALCRERAGVKRAITAYGLRHWYCTRALSTGASNAQVAALVGNTEAMVSKHYSHLDSNAQLLKELAERVSKAG